MNALRAREILAYGRSEKFFDEEIPQEDEKAVEKAEELVAMAKTAWDQYVRGDEVKTLLTMAEAIPENGNGKPESEPEAEIPIPVEIEPPPPVEEAPQEIDYGHTEPWDGYASQKGSEIIADINAAVENYEEEDLMDLLAHVWHYEANNKDRQMVTMHLEKVAKQVAKKEDTEPESQPEPAEDAPEADKVDETPPPVPLAPEPERIAEDPPLIPGAEISPEPIERSGGVFPEPEESQPEDKVDKAEGVSGLSEDDIERLKRKEVTAKTLELEKQLKDDPPESDDNPPLDDGFPDYPIDDDYSNLIKHVEAELTRERLHKPSPPQDEVKDLPWDWTKMTDTELQAFYGEFTSLAYYKNYVLAHEERMAMHCKSAAEELHRNLLNLADKYDHKDKAKTITILEAEIEADDNVKTWRRRQRKHEIFAQAARQERDSYNKLVESLSRLETMRHNEWERSGGKVGRSRK